jgi:hypothetical protein
MANLNIYRIFHHTKGSGYIAHVASAVVIADTEGEARQILTDSCSSKEFDFHNPTEYYCTELGQARLGQIAGVVVACYDYSLYSFESPYMRD